MMIQVIGFIAAFLTSVSYVPQAIKTIKTKDTSGLSLSKYVTFVSGVAIWLVYGILVRDIVVITANVLTLILSSIILYICLINQDNKK